MSDRPFLHWYCRDAELPGCGYGTVAGRDEEEALRVFEAVWKREQNRPVPKVYLQCYGPSVSEHGACSTATYPTDVGMTID